MVKAIHFVTSITPYLVPSRLNEKKASAITRRGLKFDLPVSNDADFGCTAERWTQLKFIHWG